MAAAAEPGAPRRWWFVPRGTELRYEVEIVAWQEDGAIVIADHPGSENRPIYVRLSELRSDPS